MKDYRNIQTAPTLTEYLYNHVGHPATHIALRARGQYSQFISDLNRNQTRDRIAEAIAEYSATADDNRKSHSAHRAKAETLREEADRLYKLADNVTTDPADRAIYLSRADELSTEADRQTEEATNRREYAEDTEREHNHTTLTDREDIVHEAITAYLEHMHGKDWSNIDTRNEAFLTAIKRAGTYAHTLAGSAGATHNRTYVTSMTEDEKRKAERNGETITEEEAETRAKATRADIIRKYGSLDQKQPFATRGGMLDGWTTYEHRNTPKHKGYFKVVHYKRIAPQPINEEALNIAIRADIFDSYDTTELLQLGKFSERESMVLCLLAETHADENGIYISTEAQKIAEAGQKAVDQYRAECDERKKACTVQKSRDNIERQFKRMSDTKRQTAEVRTAFTLCGTTPTALDMSISRFRAKLEKAVEATHRANTARQYRGTTPRPNAHPHLTVYSNQSAPATEYSTINPIWTDSAHKPISDHDKRTKEQVQTMVDRMTIQPTRATESDYRAIWAIWDTLTQYREELPREERYEALLSIRETIAFEEVNEAHRHATNYSPKDTSEEARQARRSEAQAKRKHDEAQRKYRDQMHIVRIMREFIQTHTR